MFNENMKLLLPNNYSIIAISEDGDNKKCEILKENVKIGTVDVYYKNENHVIDNIEINNQNYYNEFINLLFISLNFRNLVVGIHNDKALEFFK